MIKRLLSLALAIMLALSAASVSFTALAQENELDFDPVDYANPLIGTHNFKGNSEFAGLAPFVTSPFGMTNFTAQTRENRIGGISYQYEDTSIAGFFASHQPAIWMGDYGYVNIMPEVDSVKTKFNDRKLSFSHDDETSTPYYYKVKMDAGNERSITAELTATERCAIYNFTFPQNEASSILVEAARDRASGTAVIDVEKQEITGYNTDNMSSHLNNKPPKNLKGYYVIQFSKPFSVKGTYKDYNITSDSTETSGKAAGAYVSFETEENEVVQVKIGTSFISVEQARKNLEKEIPNWDFDSVKNALKETWSNKLKNLEIYGATEDEKYIFYTAMYHALLFPRMFYEETDEGNKYYSPYDDQIHSGVSYTDFSIWDTFRAENSFLTLVAPERVDGMVQSLLQNYQEGGYMPKWPNPYYTNIMIGTHADSIVAEAIKKGFDGFDYDLAYQAVYKDAIVPPQGDLNTRWGDRQTGVPYEARGGLTYYKALGYVPNENTNENVSRTLEFAYDDWCVAQVAKAVGKEEDYKFFINRSQNYRNAISPVTHLATGRDMQGNWGGGSFTEGNSLKYSWFALQDPQGLINHMGLDFYNARLIEAFDKDQLEHQNEPSHHYAYMFDFSGRPDLAQKYARKVLKESYSNDMAGMLGNDDCGQMSAWYIFSAMGFYPVNPASGEYMIGSPIFDKVVINNPKEGTKFEIVANDNQDENNYYIQSATLNGESLNVPYITHDQITAGGSVTFNMGNTASDWAADYVKEALPYYEDAVNPEEGYVPTIGDSEVRILVANKAKSAKIEAAGTNSSLMLDGKYNTGYISNDMSGSYLEENPFYITMTWDEPVNFNTISIWGNYPKSQGVQDINIEVMYEDEWETIVENQTFDWKTDQEEAEQAVIDVGSITAAKGVRIKVNKASLKWSHFAIREIEMYDSYEVNLDNPTDIQMQMLLNLNKLTGIYLNDQLLTEGEDYAVDENDVVTIKGESFASCPANKNAQVKFTFSYGKDSIINVPVVRPGNSEAELIRANIVKDATIDATNYAGKGGDIDVPNVSLKDGNYGIGYISQNIPNNSWFEENPYYITFDWSDNKQFSKISIFSNFAREQGPTDMNVEIVGADGEWETAAENLTIDWQTNGNAAEEGVLDLGKTVTTVGMRIKINKSNLVWSHIAIREVEIYEDIIIDLDAPRDVYIQTALNFNTLDQVKINDAVLDVSGYEMDENEKLTIFGESFAQCTPGEDARVTLSFSRGDDIAFDIPVIKSGNSRVEVIENVALKSANVEATTWSTGDSKVGPPSSMTDGNYGVGWASGHNPSYPQDVTITFDKPQSVDRMKLFCNFALSQAPTNVDVLVSKDGQSGWTTIASNVALKWSTDEEKPDVAEIIFPMAESVKGVRLQINSATTKWGRIAIREIELYGSNAVNVDAADAEDIDVKMILNGNSLIDIFNGENALIEGTDYTINDDLVVIKADYLKALSTGEYNLSFVFTQGAKPKVKLIVKGQNILQYIEQIEPITVNNNAEKSAQGLNLPETVTINTTDGQMKAEVVWDVDSCGYVRENIFEQSFAVNGTVTLPQDVINADDVSLDVIANVTVAAAEIEFTSDKTAYMPGQNITLTAVVPDYVLKVGVANENGNLLGIVSRDCAPAEAEGYNVWTLTLSMGTVGNRQLSLYVLDENFDMVDSGKVVDMVISKVLPDGDAPVGVRSVRAPQAAAVGEVFTLTIRTETSAANIGIFDADTGRAIGKVAQSYVDKDGVRIWTVSVKVGTKGNRSFDVKAAGLDKVWSDTSASFDINVYKY